MPFLRTDSYPHLLQTTLTLPPHLQKKQPIRITMHRDHPLHNFHQLQEYLDVRNQAMFHRLKLGLSGKLVHFPSSKMRKRMVTSESYSIHQALSKGVQRRSLQLNRSQGKKSNNYVRNPNILIATAVMVSPLTP
ncbi:hypothetical protein PoB_006833600 [Plakobranchus ocellatus]|uniref:Uncharacterized protein n=1 Tax=Plakobranchus ocellatus TaxID=259542 RepID=A0AAV4DCH1_9GAST|nr:hypothetical protein PoB_006833600 [Plakobranchus ocellatus]